MTPVKDFVVSLMGANPYDGFDTAGRELDRYVVWDYIKRRRHIIS